LYGLQQEHKKMMTLLIELKKNMKKRCDGSTSQASAGASFEQLAKQIGPVAPVAGKTSDFVNSILDNVAAGIGSGGLDKI